MRGRRRRGRLRRWWWRRGWWRQAAAAHVSSQVVGRMPTSPMKTASAAVSTAVIPAPSAPRTCCCGVCSAWLASSWLSRLSSSLRPAPMVGGRAITRSPEPLLRRRRASRSLSGSSQLGMADTTCPNPSDAVGASGSRPREPASPSFPGREIQRTAPGTVGKQQQLTRSRAWLRGSLLPRMATPISPRGRRRLPPDSRLIDENRLAGPIVAHLPAAPAAAAAVAAEAADTTADRTILTLGC